MRFIFSFLLLICISTAGYSQLNLSVLYSTGISKPEMHQNVIDRFHDNNPWIQSQFKDMKWLNGYGLGLRYKFDEIAFDLKWENLINRMSASGTDLNNDSFEQTLYFKMSSYSVGIESFFAEKLSIHASFDFTKVRYRTDVTGISDRFDIMKDWGTGSTFSIGYNFIGSSLMHVSLRPYVHFTWASHNLDALDAHLNPGVPLQANIEEDFMNFGLKVIFYNGPW